MSKFKSGIILKDKVFVPDYEDHNKMLNELGIENNSQNTENLFVKASLVPKYENMFSDIDSWELVVTQDILPDWYVKDYDKQRMVEAVKEWAKNHIHIGVDNLEITSGEGHYIKDCKDVVIYGNAIVERICGISEVEEISDNATVKRICGNATVKDIFGNATVEYIYGSATVKDIFDNATVKDIFDNATVEYIYSNATVKRIYNNATVKDIFDSATVKDIFDNATVEYIYGSATVERIYNNATVKDIFDNATVEYIYSNATVKRICGNATVKTAKGYSTIITSPYSEFKNKDKLTLLGNATLKDCYHKVIYQSGVFKFVSVSDTGKLEES